MVLQAGVGAGVQREASRFALLLPLVLTPWHGADVAFPILLVVCKGIPQAGHYAKDWITISDLPPPPTHIYAVPS